MNTLRENAQIIETLVQVERENAINCTGLGEVGCNGRQGWHSWSEHRTHVAEAQAHALAEAGLTTSPAPAVVHNHGADCMCPSCHSERLTYCRLSRGYPEHQNHQIPECPVPPTSPAASTGGDDS